jgi:hypothetical protein
MVAVRTAAATMTQSRRSIVDMDMVDVGPPRVRIWPVRGQPGLSPALMWDDLVPGRASTEGGVLACPWCGLSSRLRLAGIYFATPGPGGCWPSLAVDIDVMAATVNFPGVEATELHGEASNGVRLAIECWCANGCRGRLELCQHADAREGLDVVVLNLVALPGFPPEVVDSDEIDPDDPNDAGR